MGVRVVARLRLQVHHDSATFGQSKRRFERLCQAFGRVRPGLQAINHDVDRMTLIARQRRDRVELVQGSAALTLGCDAHPGKALSA